MKPWHTIDTAEAADGKKLVLQERDGVYVIRVGGHELMSSARHESEEALAEVGLENCSGNSPTVLIGGLGLGYTLRAALDRLPPTASVIVVEVSPAVVAWNRGPLAHLAGAPLEDPRATVEVSDVGRFTARTPLRFDSVLLDVDNGPTALSRSSNQQLYAAAGLNAFRRALRPGGRLVVWSAGPAPSWWPFTPATSADETSITNRSGSLSRKTVKVGALVPVTTTWAPVAVDATFSSLSVFSSEARAFGETEAASAIINDHKFRLIALSLFKAIVSGASQWLAPRTQCLCLA
jgi:hypothetical protein